MEPEDKLKLSKECIDYLTEQPESGMGYQIVDVILENGTVLLNRIVFNSEFLKLNEPFEISLDEIKKIKVK